MLSDLHNVSDAIMKHIPKYTAPNAQNKNARSQSISETGVCAIATCANKSAEAVFIVAIPMLLTLGYV